MIGDDAIRPAASRGVGLTVQLQPQETVRSKREPVWLLSDRREVHVPEHLHRCRALQFLQLQIDGLCKSRQIGNAQYLLLLIAPEICQHFAIGRIQKSQRAPAKHPKQFAQRDHVAHPAQQRRGIALLRLYIYGFVTQGSGP